MRQCHDQHTPRPYKVIVTDDPHQTLGEGDMRHYPTMLDAANAFVQSDAPYKQILNDNGHDVRELNEREQRLLETVCHMLGYDIEQIEG